MSTDLARIMSRDRRTRDLLNTPDLSGDALLFVLAVYEVAEGRKDAGTRMGPRSQWTADVERIVIGAATPQRRWVRSVLRIDYRNGRTLPKWLPTETWDEIYAWAWQNDVVTAEAPGPGLRLVTNEGVETS
ncbi:hypothetical protein [Gordonia aichiensis]|uniref:hypothetical protein n=1 Tax=Gordonia aichiensis TaxID=36820 RepID=UPI003264C756